MYNSSQLQFSCNLCNSGFDFKPNLREHVEKEHGKFKKLEKKSIGHPCQICNKVFTKPCHLKRHNLQHSGIRSFKCEICSFSATQRSTLLTHFAVHNQQLRTFCCPKCSIRFAQRGNLLLHLKKVHPSAYNGANEYACSKCSCSFTALNSLNSHITKMHTFIDDPTSVAINPENSEKTLLDQRSNPILMNSEIVYKVNNEIKTLQVQSITTIEGQKLYQCKDCSKKFHKLSGMIRHTRIHSPEKPWVCPECSKSFTLEQTLKTHQKTHLQKPKHICTNCSREFNNARNLQNHMKLHNKIIISKQDLVAKEPVEDELQCKDCGLTFNCKKSFDLHSDPETVFECGVCKVQLTDHICLKNHLSTHSRETQKKFQCPSCQQIFDEIDECQKHIEEFHGDINQENCSKAFIQQLTDIYTNYEKTVEQLELVNYESLPPTPNILQENINTPKSTIEVLEDQLGEFIKINDMSAILQRKIPNISVEHRSDDLSYIQEVTNNNLDSLIVFEPENAFLPEDLIEMDNSLEDDGNTFKIPDDPTEKLTESVISDSKKRKYICSTCSKAFTKKCDLDRHFRSLHSSERPYQCAKCSKAFSLKSTLTRHEEIHNTNRSGLICDVCNKILATRNSLRLHMQIHSDLFNLTCKFCDMTFRHSSNLRSHLQAHINQAERQGLHPEQVTTRNYLNAMAKRATKSSVGNMENQNQDSFKLLVVNMKFHCDKCDKGFTVKSSLNRHLKTAHKD